MTIKQHGGVFGRNPSFNNVEAESITIAGNAVPDASTILVDGDIGSTVQAYDADTTKNDVANTFTADQTFSANVGIGTSTTPLGPVDVKLANSRHVVVKYDTQNTISSENDAGSPESLRFYGDDIYFYTPQGGYTPADLTLAMHIKTQTGNLAFPSGQGIDFSATAGTGTSELFDDYEEGAWTPTLTFATAGDVSVTYSNQIGSYVKVGRTVVLTCRVTTSAFTHSTASGALRITGIPFAAAGSHYAHLLFNGINKTNYTSIAVNSASGSTVLTFSASGMGQGQSGVAVADVPSGGAPFIQFTLCYETDS